MAVWLLSLAGMSDSISRYIQAAVLSAAVALTGMAHAQERDHQADEHKRYEDKAHNDSHEWNDKEDQAYRRYLQERHKKYHDFAKASKKEQSDYWNWRHEHPDDRR